MRLRGILIALVCVLLVAGIIAFDRDLFDLEWTYYDTLTRRIAKNDRPDPRIVIVAVTDDTVRALEPVYGRPPYSRALMAMALSELQHAGASAVAFDLLFSEQNLQDDAGDREFAAALAAQRSVIGVDTSDRKPIPIPAEYQPKLWKLEPGPPLPVYRLATPLLQFAGAEDIGSLRLHLLGARTTTARRYALVDRVSLDRYAPTLALAIARSVRGLPREASWSGNGTTSALTVGKLRIPCDRDTSFLIRYAGSEPRVVEFSSLIVGALTRSGEESGISLEDIDRKEREIFNGRIVLIGYTATGLFDLRATPLSPKAPGVLIHANAIDNLLNGSFNRDVSPWLLGIVMLAVAALFGAAVFPIRSQIIAALLAALVILAWLAAEYVALRSGIVIFAIGPAISIALAYVAITVTKFVAEQRHTQQLKATFGRYVSPQILDWILAHPEKIELGGERRDLTILFSDIRGFTTISEAAEPEEVVEMLNEYLTRMVDILLKYGGTLDKFIGDAVMGFWNAPAEDPDHARHAVECAIEMIEETARLRAQWETEGKAALRIGIGINTGDAVVGNIGSEKVFGYTVIGDAVNLASRLESKNKDYGTEIIISEFTKERIGEGFPTTYLDEVKVKGKDKAVKIFQVKESDR